MKPEDLARMARALALAERGRGLTSPNPMVGAVLVRDGEIVGEGFHAEAGGPHAEVVALAAAGERGRGATLYVTLEPCNHHGRTPPCTRAIRNAGVARVVAGAVDPNPHVIGGGADVLRAAGIEVAVGARGDEVRAQNRAFFTAMRRGRPHVTLKAAMTLDGKIAAQDGTSRWITGAEARAEAHRLRSESDAVVVGIGTALADDPALNVRLEAPWPREPWRVVVDSRARLPVHARVIRAGRAERAIVAITDAAPPERVAALEAAGATVMACKSAQGRVDLADLAARLFALDVIAMLVEGGAELNAGFVEAGLVDRIAIFLAPKVLGGAGAPTPVGGPGRSLSQALHLARPTVRPIGDDWLVEADVAADVVAPDGGA
jgi:diaminohydroxyphosphoribosylaminopyrimidine deaminase/5-amino-6-(5-phosphoribosylamino)uracil reductase